MNPCCEIHPGEGLHDGVSSDPFPERVGGHPRANVFREPSHHFLLAMDRHDHGERVRMFHAVDAAPSPTGRPRFHGG